MNKKPLMIVMALAALYLNAQNEKGTQTNVQSSNGTTVVRHRATTAAYSYEKKNGTITVQCYTKEQFDKLTAERKKYYMAHKEQYEIIKSKK
jgi:hypothetical protein